MSTSPKISIRGISVLNRPAPSYMSRAAWIIDFNWAIFVYHMMIWVFGFTPTDIFSTLIPWLVIVVLIWWIQFLAFGATLGQLLWKCKMGLIQGDAQPRSGNEKAWKKISD